MCFIKNPGPSALVVMLLLLACGTSLAQDKGKPASVDADTVKKWSAPYRNWHYYPEHVIPAKPEIKGFEKVFKTDVPTVFQLKGDDKWYMTFIGFDGQGYQSFVAESDDLVHWTNMRLAMGFGPERSFDHGGVVLGAYLYEDYDIKGRRTLKKHDGKYWSLYGAYPRQGGYELRPGYEGVATSGDGMTWRRAKDEPILSVHQPDCGEWEKSCIYQPWLVEHEGTYFNFYNAARGGIEQMGLALSDDMLTWRRYTNNPVIPNGPKGSFNERFCSDGKVFWDGDHWVVFFFGVGRGGAHIMTAFSRDLYHWTVDPEPLYRSGGNPSGLDKQYAHKISLVWNPKNETFYMFYNAVGTHGRGIGLITSKPLKRSAQQSDYKGWKTLMLENDLVQLYVVPDIGGRVIQYRFGEKEFFWVNPALVGKTSPQTGLDPHGGWMNYGGDKLWPAPQGWDNDQQWPGPPDAVLDGQPYRAEMEAKRPVILLRSRDDSRSGIRLSRRIRLHPDTTRVSLEATMTNIDNKPGHLEPAVGDPPRGADPQRARSEDLLRSGSRVG